jgi:ribose 5-phosphate isomerase B
MRVALGSDHAGLNLKKDIISLVRELGYEAKDVGCFDEASVDYPDYAFSVCQEVVTGCADRGILVCGTGIGMSIAANKITGIRAALCHDGFSARLTREHNDSNVLCLGQRVIGTGLALDIVRIWLGGEFAGGKHAARLDKIRAQEERGNDR